MATIIPEIDLFSQALRSATRDVEAFQQTLAQLPAASARAALQADPEGGKIEPAVFRPPAVAGQAGASVQDANLVGGIGVIQEIWGAAKEFYATMNAWAKSTAKYQTEVEKLQHQMGASATQAGEFGQAMLKRSQELLQSPSALVDVFGKVGTLDLDKGVDKGNLAKRTNAQEVTKSIAQIAYVRNIPAGDLADMVTPLLRPVQENMAEVRVRLAQFYNVTNDAPLPEALMKNSFVPVVNRLEQFGVAPEQSIGSAASLLDIAKLRASDPAQAVKATEELFAQFNDADVREQFQKRGVDITALRQQAKTLNQAPLQLIVKAIQNGEFNLKDLDFDLKSVMKEKQSAVLLSDLVRKQDDYVAGREAVTDKSKPQNYAEAFKARQESSLGRYRAGEVGVENAGIQFGTVPMPIIGKAQGLLGDLGNISGEDIKRGGRELSDKLNALLKKYQEGLKESGFSPDFSLPTQKLNPLLPTPMGLPLPKGEDFPSLQQAAYAPSLFAPQAAAPSALPAKAELTIHFTGLPSGVQAQVMSETEWFNIQTSMGYNIHSQKPLPPVPRSFRGPF